MEFFESLSEINIVAVAVAMVSTFIVGAGWYSWGLFGKSWASAVGLKKTDVEQSEPLVYIRTAIGSVVAAIALAMIMANANIESPIGGLLVGAFVGLCFRLTSISMHTDFAHHPKRLILIDGLHDAVQLAVVGLIIGLFP